MKQLIIILSVLSLSSCAKKYDWTCTCDYYLATGTVEKSETISHVIKSDADKLCAKWGSDNDPNGMNGAHQCSVK